MISQLIFTPGLPAASMSRRPSRCLHVAIFLPLTPCRNVTAAADDTASFGLVQLRAVTYCVILHFSSVSVVSSSSTLGFGTLACESYGSSLAAELALVEAACRATEESSIYRGRTYCADGQITRNNPRYHREWPLEARLEARVGAKLARVAQGRYRRVRLLRLSIDAL